MSDAGARILVSEEAFADRVEVLDGIDHLIVVERDGLPEAPGGFDFEAAWRGVQPDDLLTLIYTSGTTGPPKGVQLTHANLVAGIRGFDQVISFPDEGRVVSWLPMAHIAERACSHYLPMFVGFSTTCCPNPREVVAYLPDVRPSWFFAVPRIWEKLKAAIEAGIEAEQDAAKQQATRWALDVGLRKVRAEQAGEPVGEKLAAEHGRADELVLSKIRARLGLDAVESVNVGAAPTPREVIEFFHALGIPVAELWGMSETTGYGACNPPEKIKIGTVGPPLPGADIRLAEDGEVLIRGPFVMTGYRNQPDKTSEALDADGRLHTGDIGELDEDGYLKLVDRKKELIINAGGQEHVTRKHRGEAEGRVPGDRPGGRHRRRKAIQRGPADARPRRGARLRAPARPRGAPGRGRARGGGRQRPAGPRGADQEIQGAGRRVAARRRRADADHEAEAQADPREARKGDRGAVRVGPGVAAYAPGMADSG